MIEKSNKKDKQRKIGKDHKIFISTINSTLSTWFLIAIFLVTLKHYQRRRKIITIFLNAMWGEVRDFYKLISKFILRDFLCKLVNFIFVIIGCVCQISLENLMFSFFLFLSKIWSSWQIIFAKYCARDSFCRNKKYLIDGLWALQWAKFPSHTLHCSTSSLLREAADRLVHCLKPDTELWGEKGAGRLGWTDWLWGHFVEFRLGLWNCLIFDSVHLPSQPALLIYTTLYSTVYMV